MPQPMWAGLRRSRMLRSMTSDVKKSQESDAYLKQGSPKHSLTQTHAMPANLKWTST